VAFERDRLFLRVQKGFDFCCPADGFFSGFLGAVEINDKVSHDLCQVDRKRCSPLPRLQSSKFLCHQALEKGLEYIVDISCIRALADTGINQSAMPLVEASERTRVTPDNQVDQLDV